MTETFLYRSRMPSPAEGAYRFHVERDALERLTPAWEKVRVVERSGRVAARK